MQSQMQPKRDEPPPKVHGENLYYLGVQDENEREITEIWYEALKERGTKSRFVTLLVLDRLTEDHSVQCLVRCAEWAGKKRVKPTPALKHRLDPQSGQRETEKTLELDNGRETLVKELCECPVVKCSDYWIYRDGEEGELDRARFSEAIGKTCSPAAIKWQGERKMYLGWA